MNFHQDKNMLNISFSIPQSMILKISIEKGKKTTKRIMKDKIKIAI